MAVKCSACSSHVHYIAIYSDPDILFMDEGTANLDPQTEAQILDIIAGLKCTRILIAHRPKTLEVANTVYQVTGGMLRPVIKSEEENKINIKSIENNSD